MNVKMMMHVAFLYSFSFVHCMELTEPKNNTDINQTITLKMDDSLIQKFIKISKENKSNPLLFLQRTKKLNLLQQLLTNNAEITFSSDNAINFWLNKDKTIATNIVHEKLLSFLSYRPNDNGIKINHTSFFDQQKTFNLTMQYNTSLLHVTIAKYLNRYTTYTLTKFLREYGHDNVQQKRNLQHFIPDKNTIHAGDQSIQLTEDDYDLFVTLPHNTQKLLRDILLDQDGLLW